MDKRISYKIVLDTETAPIEKVSTVDPKNMLVYDIGWAVVDKRGKVYEKRSFAITDIFLDEKDLMRSDYYAEKIPTYWEEIKSGERYLRNLYTVRQILLNDIKEYNVTEIYAHNMRFDCLALNTTQRYLTENRLKYFFPAEIDICDTLKMARQVIGTMPTYRKFCEENDYLTPRGQLKMTAEVLYRFISQNNDFEEVHKGLDDVMIEKEIMAYCFKQHKKMERLLWG